MTRLTRFIQNTVNSFLDFWRGVEWGPPGEEKFIGTAIRDWMIDGLADFVSTVMKSFEIDWIPLVKNVIKEAEDTGKIPPALKPITDELKEPSKQVAAFLGQSMGATATGGIISSTIGPWLKELEYSILRSVQTFRLPPAAIIEAIRRGEELARGWPIEYEEQGITQERFDLLYEVSKVLIATEQLLELLRRGEIDSVEFKDRMLKLGYDENDVPEIEKLKDIIPPLPDMTRFADFGAFDPTIIELWREFYDAPDWIKGPMAKIGITGEWADKYWFSHWRQPGRFELGELHRRFLIDDNLVKNAYLTQGYSSFWQDLLLRLVEEPLTRVDIRRMHKLGLLTDQELSDAYHAVGYYGANNEKMVEFTKAYNSRTATEADRELTKTDILRLFADRILTEVDARDMLADLDYGPEEISYLLDLYTEDAAIKTRDLTLSQVRQLYQLGLRTKGQITPFLEKFRFSKDEIIDLYDLWDWEKPPKVSRPTRAQLDKFLASEIIPWDTWVEEYRGLGYDDRYIQWYFDLLYKTGKLEE